jgi:hypothetical protein
MQSNGSRRPGGSPCFGQAGHDLTPVAGLEVGNGRRWRNLSAWLLAAVSYVAFTIVQTWPLVFRLSDVIPNDPGDPILNTWIIWWNAHAVPFTAQWWNAPAFWPSNGALAFSEVLLGLSPITTPIQWLGGSPIAAYNVAFLLTFPLSALAAHALVHRLTGRHLPALIGGLIYGFTPFRIAHFPQIQVMTSYWMPLALLGLHQYMIRRERRWLLLFGGAWLMQALSNGYYLVFFPVLLGLWMLWFAMSRQTIRALRAIVTTFILASLPLIPLLWSYRQIHTGFGFQRDPGEVNGFGADVTSLLDASSLLKFWRLTRFHQAEGELFPGFTAMLLVLLLVIHVSWRSERVMRMPRAAALLLAGALLFLAVGLSSLLSGGWAIVVGNTTLLSVRVASKPLSIGVMLLVAALALIPRFPEAWRRRSPLMFYTLAMGLMYLLCFGPRPRFLGMPFMARGPYGLLMLLPGYDSIRVPARFAMLAALCLSVVAALTFARLTSRLHRWPRLILAIAVACGVVVDSAIGEMPLRQLPLRLASLEMSTDRTPVVELPIGYIEDDVAAMYRGIYHRRPVVNGYSGFFPPGYEVLRLGFANHDPQMFDAVTASGPVLVVVDTARDVEGQWVKQIAARPGAKLERTESGRQIFSLPGGSLPEEVTLTARLPIQTVTANINADQLPLALDGNQKTRWDGGPQRGAQVVTIDLGSTRSIDGLTMTLGSHPSDFPRALIIESSSDGREWTPRWSGSSAAVAFAAALRHPKELPLTFALAGVPARMLRLRQVGNDPMFYWSIFELAVYGR